MLLLLLLVLTGRPARLPATKGPPAIATRKRFSCLAGEVDATTNGTLLKVATGKVSLQALYKLKFSACVLYNIEHYPSLRVSRSCFFGWFWSFWACGWIQDEYLLLCC